MDEEARDPRVRLHPCAGARPPHPGGPTQQRHAWGRGCAVGAPFRPPGGCLATGASPSSGVHGPQPPLPATAKLRPRPPRFPAPREGRRHFRLRRTAPPSPEASRTPRTPSPRDPRTPRGSLAPRRPAHTATPSPRPSLTGGPLGPPRAQSSPVRAPACPPAGSATPLRYAGGQPADALLSRGSASETPPGRSGGRGSGGSGRGRGSRTGRSGRGTQARARSRTHRHWHERGPGRTWALLVCSCGWGKLRVRPECWEEAPPTRGGVPSDSQWAGLRGCGESRKRGPPGLTSVVLRWARAAASPLGEVRGLLLS